jgi:adenine-specific DNA methylase
MKPPALPSKERHDPISDPVLLAKVKMAREILHRDYVTDEDIGRLERAGHFEHLFGETRPPDSVLPSAAAPAK